MKKNILFLFLFFGMILAQEYQEIANSILNSHKLYLFEHNRNIWQNSEKIHCLLVYMPQCSCKENICYLLLEKKRWMAQCIDCGEKKELSHSALEKTISSVISLYATQEIFSLFARQDTMTFHRIGHFKEIQNVEKLAHSEPPEILESYGMLLKKYILPLSKLSLPLISRGYQTNGHQVEYMCNKYVCIQCGWSGNFNIFPCKGNHSLLYMTNKLMCKGCGRDNYWWDYSCNLHEIAYMTNKLICRKCGRERDWMVWKCDKSHWLEYMTNKLVCKGCIRSENWMIFECNGHEIAYMTNKLICRKCARTDSCCIQKCDRTHWIVYMQNRLMCQKCGTTNFMLPCTGK